MVHVAQMRDFVRDDVVLDEGGGHQQAPAQGQGLVGGAASPAAGGVFHRDPFGGDADQAGFRHGQRAEAAQGFAAEEIADSAGEELRRAGDVQFLVQQEGAASRRRGVADAMGDAADRHQGAVGEADRLRQGGQAVGYPIGVAHQQGHAGFAGRSGRQSHDDGASGRVDT